MIYRPKYARIREVDVKEDNSLCSEIIGYSIPKVCSNSLREKKADQISRALNKWIWVLVGSKQYEQHSSVSTL